jgi:hypothetical protein
MSLSKVAWLILGTAGLAAAHGHIYRIDIDGKSYGGFLVDQYPHEQNVPDLIAWSTADTQDAYVQPLTTTSRILSATRTPSLVLSLARWLLVAR